MNIAGQPALGAITMIAGIAHGWAAAVPWGGQPAWWLQILALGGLVLCLQAVTSARQASLLGLCFGIAWFCATFWWLFISMHRYGGLAAPFAALAVFALTAALSLYLALAMAAWHVWRPRSTVARAMFLSLLWMLAELARGQVLTGFPWGASGYAHITGPLVVLAPWVGVYGIGCVACALSVAWADCLRRFASGKRIWDFSGAHGALAGFVVLAVIGLNVVPPTFSRAAGHIDVALLQGNIPQNEKFQPDSGVATGLRWYAEQIHQSNHELTIAPETAIPLLHHQLPPEYWETLSDRFARDHKGLLVGMPAGDSRTGYTNSAFGLRPGQSQAYRYDKHHLVPFGEFVPPLFRWFTELMNIPLGDFAPGALVQPPFEWRGQRIAPNICYEDLFGEELASRFIIPNQAPTLFANLSNIAWFGDGIAIDQHVVIARMRALEFERPFVRATNTGATVIIDHRGVVTHALERSTRGVLAGKVEGREGLTPYAWWAGNWGLWPLWLIGSAGVIIFAINARRNPKIQAVART